MRFNLYNKRKTMFNNKSILITGGTGSFGQKFVKTLLFKYNPKKIIIFSRDELKQFNMLNNLKKYEKKLRFFLEMLEIMIGLNLL